jgi:hypothetical protein
MDRLIKTRWKVLPEEQRSGIRNFVVGVIVKTSSDEQTLRREKSFVNKLNLILVQILKQEWCVLLSLAFFLPRSVIDLLLPCSLSSPPLSYRLYQYLLLHRGSSPLSPSSTIPSSPFLSPSAAISLPFPHPRHLSPVHPYRPHNWPTFIPEIVTSSQANLSICENNMVILKLLSEEIFEFSAEQMTTQKTKALKAQIVRSVAFPPFFLFPPRSAGEEVGQASGNNAHETFV